MMITISVLASFVLTQSAGTGLPAVPASRLTVKEVLLQEPIRGGAEFAWWLQFCQGDMTGDGKAENLVIGTNVGYPSQPVEQWRDAAMLMNGFKEGPVFTFDQPVSASSPYYLPNNWPDPTLTTLFSPLGPLIVGPEIHPERYVARILGSNAYVGEFDIPPPPPGYPPIFSIRGIYRAPDVNSDGWEELYFQANADSFAVFGLMDGATLTARWLHYEPRFSGVAPTLRPDYGRTDDLDGDLVPDFLFAYMRSDAPPINTWVMRIVAVSGVDGSRIWVRELGRYGICIFTGEDFTGDGLEDVLANTNYGTVALDGASGATLWERDASSFDYLLPNSQITLHFIDSPLVTRWPDRGDALVGLLILRGSEGYLDKTLFLVLDLASGALLEVHELPTTIAPWTPDPTPSYRQHLFCGDIDGDGYLEFALPVRTLSLDNPATPLQYPVGMAYFGPQTFILPEFGSSGGCATGWVTLPAAASCDYHLIGSLSFDPWEGLRHDGVPTHFVQDRLFNQLLGRGRIHGRLDAQGEANISVSLPGDPALIGRKLYLRVLATEPGEPWRMKTMSSVATVEIVP